MIAWRADPETEGNDGSFPISSLLGFLFRRRELMMINVFRRLNVERCSALAIDVVLWVLIVSAGFALGIMAGRAAGL